MKTHGGKRTGAGMKPGSKKTKLKPAGALKVTKGIRYTHQQIERIVEAARQSGSKNFSRFVVTASVDKADAILKQDA